MIYTPATSDFDALAFGSPHPGTIDYIRRKIESIPATFNDRGAAFMADIHERWDNFMGSDAMRRARAVKERLFGDSVYQTQDGIYAYDHLPQVQNAGIVMQKYIMSEPSVRRMYYDQRCDGFSQTYVDPFPGKIGEEDYNYRKVMQGAVTDTKDGGWVARIWIDDVAEGDVPLAFDERAKILTAWETVRWYMENGREDPTSSEGGFL